LIKIKLCRILKVGISCAGAAVLLEKIPDSINKHFQINVLEEMALRPHYKIQIILKSPMLYIKCCLEQAFVKQCNRYFLSALVPQPNRMRNIYFENE
jgi:hypothetical protein